MNDNRCLVLFDANQIRDYVFASGRLREIRGASEQVRRLTDEKLISRLLGIGRWDPSSPFDEGIVYADGGAGAIVVSSPGRAKVMCQELEKLFRRQTGVASLSAVSVPIESQSKDAEAKAQRVAARALARRKSERAQAVFQPGVAVRFCESDRIEPAQGKVTMPGPSDILLVSHATATKHRLSRRYRASLIRSPFWQEFIHDLPNHDLDSWVQAVNPTQDVGTIGRQSDPAGYVALIYADGDGVGAAIREIVREKGIDGYRSISNALSSAAITATAKSVACAYGSRPPQIPPAENVEREDEGPNLPFEVITIGGDDIVLICTAESALEIACSMARTFEQVTEEKLGASITLSLGVVIAHATMPIGTLERMGRELLKSAKRVEHKSSIDFHIATASGIDHLPLIRAAEYQVGTSTELTLRPYDLASAAKLVRHARTLAGGSDSETGTSGGESQSGLPRSKVRQLHDACRGDAINASLNVLGVHSRLGARHGQDLLNALRDLECHVAYPFTGNPYRRQTALIDLLEASQFSGRHWSDD